MDKLGRHPGYAGSQRADDRIDPGHRHSPLPAYRGQPRSLNKNHHTETCDLREAGAPNKPNMLYIVSTDDVRSGRSVSGMTPVSHCMIGEVETEQTALPRSLDLV
jgi:hypothetical protein